ncbi:MAG: fumarylacetoacetate hydrolase family protein, partial [Planctomycetaceae bacterium]
VTLEPGDIISTGTTAGVGASKGRFLKDGDQVEAEIAGIGNLRNPVQGP